MPRTGRWGGASRGTFSVSELSVAFPSDQTKRPVRSPSLLAVDDDLEVLELIAEVLKNEGYDVSVATSMEAAEEHLKRKPANVVILDIFMPGKGGIGGIQAIRQHHPATRTIAISGGWGAATAAQSTEAAKKLGADAIMQKPFKMSELVRQVREVIGTA